ncbi:thyrotropin-releasing hormone receptor-like [Amphiura filiformis]|uniref:thyrotropin-releasing hormone receptor-like n=1 Tax=Amphiura filiformis TaxID=82378 RepID=UPI003B21F8A3
MSSSDAPDCITVPENLSETYAHDITYKPIASISVTVILPFILTSGLVINTAFLYVVGRVRRMHTVTNLFLVNLAVADTVFLAVVCGEQIVLYINSPVSGDRLFMGLAGCVAIPLLVYTCYFASLAFVTIVSVHRFFATCRPLNLKMIRSKNRAIKLSILAWLLSLMMSLLVIPESNKFVTICVQWPSTPKYSGYPEMIGLCWPSAEWVQPFADILRSIPFFFAMVGNNILYLLIIISLRKRSPERRQREYDEPSSQICSAQKRSGSTTVAQAPAPVHSQVARMLVINGIIFFLCQAPHQGGQIASSIGGITGVHTSLLNPEQFEAFTWFSKALVYINSAVNPIIYNLTNTRYRRAFKETLSWKCESDS